MERITRKNLEERIANLNRRMEEGQARYRYQVEARNGYIALDRFYRDAESARKYPGSVPGRGIGWIMTSTVMIGTKREVGDFLHAMMVAIDDFCVSA